MKKIFFSITLLTVLAAVFAFTLPTTWQISGKHTISFSTSGVSGIFKSFKGSIVFDQQNVAASKFDVDIDVASINTGNGMQNKHAKSSDWFDAAKYPSIKFTSTTFQKVGNAYQVTGNLQMHGVTRPVSIPFRFKTAGSGGTFEGSFTVNRNDFGIGKQGGDVGDVIKLAVVVPVIKK